MSHNQDQWKGCVVHKPVMANTSRDHLRFPPAHHHQQQQKPSDSHSLTGFNPMKTSDGQDTYLGARINTINWIQTLWAPLAQASGASFVKDIK
jgi:hypothetical protein